MVHGIDVSNNNGPVDWRALYKQGNRFAWLKVSEGAGFADGHYAGNNALARAAGFKVGGYHFGHPSSDPVEQADRFLSLLRLRPGDLLPVLDIEASDGLPAYRVQAWAAAWLARVHAKTGAKPAIYSGNYFARQNLGGLIHVYPMWVASYGARPTIRWDAWQVSGSGIDRSVAPNLVCLTYRPGLVRRVVRPVARGVSPLWRRFGRL